MDHGLEVLGRCKHLMARLTVFRLTESKALFMSRETWRPPNMPSAELLILTVQLTVVTDLSAMMRNSKQTISCTPIRKVSI